MATVTATVGRGVGHSQVVGAATGSPLRIVYSTVDFSGANPIGSDPITLLLNLLISTGDASNYSGSGTNYDNQPNGIGLGIPQEWVDIAAFEAIQAEYDYDTNQRLHLIFDESYYAEGVNKENLANDVVTAKKFIDEEICRPFGLSMFTGNDGRLKLARPRNPHKFYVSKANNALLVKVPSAGTTYTATVTTGVYNYTEMATEVQRALNAAMTAGATGRTFTCTYSTSTRKFTLSIDSGTFDITTSTDDGWAALGWTTVKTNVSSTEADEARGTFSGTTIDAGDVWGVRIHDASDMLITSVVFQYNYNFETDEFTSQREYIDARAANRLGLSRATQFVIKAKGLIGGPENGVVSFGYWKSPASGCDPEFVAPESQYWVNDDSWSKTYAVGMLDRYREVPIKFSCKLPWEFNTLELHDNVQFSYSIDGIFADTDLRAATITDRLFEVIEFTPNPKAGYCEATFLSHRPRTSPSPLTVTVR